MSLRLLAFSGFMFRHFIMPARTSFHAAGLRGQFRFRPPYPAILGISWRLIMAMAALGPLRRRGSFGAAY